MSPVFGFATFLMDGAKLFAKSSANLDFRLGYGFTICALVFAAAYLWIVCVFVHVGLLFCSAIALGSVLFALSVVELFELGCLQISRNAYVALAISRSLLIFVLNEIAFGFGLLIILFLDLSTSHHF